MIIYALANSLSLPYDRHSEGKSC